MTTHSSIHAWRIPWTEEPDGMQSIGLQRVGHDWSDLAHAHIYWVGQKDCLGFLQPPTSVLRHLWGWALCLSCTQQGRAAFPCLFSFHGCPTAVSIPPLTVNQWVGFARAPSAEQKDLFLARLRGSPMFCREWGRVELLLWETIPGSNMSLHLHPIIAHRLISSDLGHAPMGAMVRPVRSVSFVRNHVSFKLGIWTWLLGLKQKSPASGNFTSLSMSAEPAALGRLSRVALGSQDWVQLPMAHCRLI